MPKPQSKPTSKKSRVRKAAEFAADLAVDALEAGVSGLGIPGLGKAVGMLSRKVVGGMTGRGEYHIRFNELINGGGELGFSSSNQQVVALSLYLGEMTASNDYSYYTIPLNPGLDQYGKMAHTAKLYEEWAPLGIVVEYRGTATDYTGTGFGTGTVSIGTQYDPTAPAFSSKIDLEEYDYSSSAKVTESLFHGVECKKGFGTFDWFKVRHAPPATDDERMFSDYGNTFVAVSGTPAAAEGQVIGEVWIHMKISFRKMRSIPRAVPGTYFSSIRSGVALATPFGTTVVDSLGKLPVTVTSTGNVGTIILDPEITSGRFSMKAYIGSSVIGTYTGPASVAFTNCTPVVYDMSYATTARSQWTTSPGVLTIGYAGYVGAVVDVDGFSSTGSSIAWTWGTTPHGSATTKVQIEIIAIENSPSSDDD